MSLTEHQQLELQAAADELGVHYQTAYRWVRSGRLDAQLVDGRYLVDRDAIDALAAARSAPRQPPPPRATRLDHAADKAHTSLLDGDEAAVTKLAGRLVEEGASVTDVIQQVLVPSLRRIGQAWHDGELAIATEHRASAIVERVLGGLAPNPRGRRRGTAVVAAVSGDRHVLPTTMAAVALRSDNWRVEHLGADLPPDEILAFCSHHEVSVAVLTSTNPDTFDATIAVARRLTASGTPTLVGRPGDTLDDLMVGVRAAAGHPRGRVRNKSD